MPSYRYRAVHASGRIAQGDVAAANEWELAQYLTDSGLELIEAKEKKEKTTRWHLPRRVTPRALALFSAHMVDLLKAGVSFMDALRDITKATDTDSLHDPLTNIMRAINHGSTIAKAFSAYPRIFPDVYIAILAAGESSGNLNETFAHLSHYAEGRARTHEQLKKALRYPLFLLAVAVGVIAFMMLMVVPHVILYLNSIDNQLPLVTRFLITVSELFAEFWWIILLGVIAGISLIPALRKNSGSAALLIDGFMLRLPVVGELINKLSLARFAHSFSILFQSGVGILSGLRSAKVTLNNRALEEALEESDRQIQAGRSLSLALEGLLPPSALRMIKVGEQSGQLGKSLNDIAEHYDREVTSVTQRLIGSLEPALTIMMGIVLAWVVLAVLGPIYNSLSTLNEFR